MDLKAIQYVQEIVKAGSFTKASEQLYLSQSALSQYISRLESSLGVPLFIRKGIHLSLTPAGEIFLREGTNVLDAYEHMCQHIHQLSSGVSQTVRLGISGFYGSFFLPYLFPMMKEECPSVQIHIVQETSPVLQTLVRERVLDFCVSPFREAADDLTFEYLCTEEIMIAVPADCPVLTEAVPGPDFPSLDLSLLKDYPFLMMQKGQVFTPMSYALCASAGFTPHVTAELMGWTSIQALIGSGIGVSFLPRELAGRPSGNGPVSFCRIIAPMAATRPISITLPKDAELSPAVKSAIDMLKRIAELPDFPF